MKMKIKRTFIRKLAKILAPRFGYTVVGVGYLKRHYSLSYNEALSWAACYDDGALIVRKDIIIAHKGTIK